MARCRCRDMDEFEDLTRRIGGVLADQPVAFSYMFGSLARTDASGASDTDVAVHFETGMAADERLARSLRFGVDLERALYREVDLVDLEYAPLRLVGRILTERVVVAGLQRPERVRFEDEIAPPQMVRIWCQRSSARSSTSAPQTSPTAAR